MQRIDTPNKAEDLFGSGKHGFRDGNKALGIAPTELNAAFFNSIQEEIAHVIEQAGGALDSGNLTQLYTAIQAMIAGSLTSEVALQGAFRNLTGSASGLDADVDYAVDEIVLGDGAGNYAVARNVTETITMSTSGAGGLDTGAVAASTWYYGYIIGKDDGTVAALASLSASSPTLPAGYTKWARVGAFRTDATANKYPLAFKQSGARVAYAPAAGTNLTAYPVMASGSPGAFPISVGVVNFVPSTARRIKVGVKGSNVIGPSQFIKYGPSSVDPTVYFSGESASQGGNYWVTDESDLLGSNVFWGASSSGTGTLMCMGWVDSI